MFPLLEYSRKDWRTAGRSWAGACRQVGQRAGGPQAPLIWAISGFQNLTSSTVCRSCFSCRSVSCRSRSKSPSAPAAGDAASDASVGRKNRMSISTRQPGAGLGGGQAGWYDQGLSDKL